MTRNYDGNGVASACTSHGPGAGTETVRKVRITHYNPGWNPLQHAPHAILKRRPTRGYRQSEDVLRIFEIGMELVADLLHKCAFRCIYSFAAIDQIDTA